MQTLVSYIHMPKNKSHSPQDFRWDNDQSWRDGDDKYLHRWRFVERKDTGDPHPDFPPRAKRREPLKLQLAQLPRLALGPQKSSEAMSEKKGLRWYQGFRILCWERRIFQQRKQASDLPQNVSSPQTLRKDSSASTSSQSLGVSARSCQDSLLYQPRCVCSQLKCWGRTHMLEGFTRGPGASQVLAPDPGC